MTAAPSLAGRRSALAALAVAASGAAWGGFWYPLRWLESLGLGGAWVSVVFFAVSGLLPLPFLLGEGAWRGASRQLVTGAVLGLAFALYTASLVLTDVIHAVLLFYLTPVWSTLAGVILLGERLSPARGLAIVLGFAGMAFVLGSQDGLPLPRNEGDWLALASGMLWAAGTMRSYLYPARGVALPVFTFCLGGVAASLIVLVAAIAVGSPIAALDNPARGLAWAGLFAVVIFAPPNFLVLWAAQRIDAGRVGILLMTEVLAGAATAALFSGEAFGVTEAAGTALIVCAGLVEVLGRR